jgi:hypothetical protein
MRQIQKRQYVVWIKFIQNESLANNTCKRKNGRFQKIGVNKIKNMEH